MGPVQARHLADGERLEMGEVVFEVLHTPGCATSSSWVTRPAPRGEGPALLLTGGALLVEPDLWGARKTQAPRAGTVSDPAAFRYPMTSKSTPHMWQAPCAEAILAVALDDARLRAPHECPSGTPRPRTRRASMCSICPPCRYWRRMRQLNQAGPPQLGVLPEPPALRPEAFERCSMSGPSCSIVASRRGGPAFLVL